VRGRLDFGVLGPLEVVGDRGAMALVKGKARAALGVLLIHANEVVATDRLIDDSWGAHPPVRARGKADPRATNASADGRTLSRRVELHVSY
jgi:hypothetical protein